MTTESKRALIALLQEFRNEQDGKLARVITSAQSLQRAAAYEQFAHPQLERIDQVVRHVKATIPADPTSQLNLPIKKDP